MNSIIELINQSGTVAILGHDREDADSVGSCYAVKEALVAMGKNVECYFSEEPEKRLGFMGKEYTVFDETCVPCVDLCLCLDCADLSRTGKRKAIFASAKNTACIDHHETNPGFADANWIDGSSPATGEMIYKLLDAMGVVITRSIARNLYAAISSDTGSFKYSNVRPETLRITAELLKLDIGHAEIARYLYDTEPLALMHFKGRVMESVEQYFGGKLNIVCAHQALLDEFSLKEKDTGDIVNIPRAVEGCEIAVSLRETGERIKMSFRSNGKYNVSKLAAIFGGGGHNMAAGADQKGKTLLEVKEAVIKACEEVLNG